MSRKNDTFKVEGIKNGKSLVSTITNNLNKHGEIKGENKKETKKLKAVCPHHRVNKKGKIRPTIENHDGVCYCKMCGAEFRAPLYENKELSAIVNKYKGVLNQAKFITQSADMGENMIGFFANANIYASETKKQYKKIRKIAEKSDRIKKKKGGKNRNNGGYNSNSSDNYGSWG